MRYYSKSLDTLLEELLTNFDEGLTTTEAKKRLESDGLNEIPKASKGFIKVYLAPLFNWLIVIYLMGALIMYFASLTQNETDLSMIYVTLGIVGVNALVAIFQQARATKKLNALRELSAPKSIVLRDGEPKEILSKEIVVGDIIILRQGDKIPADARIIESANLEVNEASLTGESEPVKKNQGEPLPDKDISIGDRYNMVFQGTFVTMGSGKAVVVKTGANTEIGQISAGLEEAGSGEIPIRTKMNNFGKWLGLIVMGMWAIILVILYLSTGRWEIVKSLNSAMDIMPINIPLLTTIVLLTGVLAMAQHGVIIRNLASVDSLGRISVVCTDKTGTLTQSQMSVQHIWANKKTFTVTGLGYNPEGKIFLDKSKNDEENSHNNNKENKQEIKNFKDYPTLYLLLLAALLDNNSALQKREIKVDKNIINQWSVVGNPTEGALVALVTKSITLSEKENYEVLKEYPFDSSIKRMSKILKNKETGNIFLFSKGASEIILPRCININFGGKEQKLTEDIKKDIENAVNEWASKGFRVLSFAMKKITDYNDSERNRDEDEDKLTYLGFVTILDPPREGVKDAVEQCHAAGVEVVMITGDAPSTARAIAQQISIITHDDDLAIEGKKIPDYIENENLDKVKVFARVSPKNKEEIVKYYQEHKRVVAMTGDGVNDALALNLADAGIAMGIQGTDVAKEAADMVISDDSFNSIVEGIHQGRGIFQKIRVVVFFYIAINLFEGIVQFILAVILDLPYFLDPTYYYQWIFLSITVHMFPGLILTFDTISDDVMEEKPRDSEEILSKSTLGLMGVYGILLAISMLTVYFLGINGVYPVWPGNTELGVHNPDFLFTSATMNLTPSVNLNHAKALTMLMVVLFICESFLVLQIRRPNKSLIDSLKDSTAWMFLLLGFIFGILLALMYIPKAQVAIVTSRVEINFMFMYLTALDWIVAIAISMICVGGFEAVKYWARKRGIVF